MLQEKKRPNLFYPIFIDNITLKAYVTEDDKQINISDIKLLPITDWKEMSWRWSKKRL